MTIVDRKINETRVLHDIDDLWGEEMARNKTKESENEGK